MRRSIYGFAFLLGGLAFTPWAVVADPSAAVAFRVADPVLSRFVQTVVETNPRVQAARAALDAKLAFRDAASRPLYNPELSFDAEDADSEIRAIGISQTFDWADKRQARTAVAESERLAAEAEYLAVRWTVTVELLSGLASHQTGVERNEVAAERVRLMNEFAMLAERRFDAGDLNQVEFDLAVLASTQARMQNATAATELAEARQALRNLVLDTSASGWPTLPFQLPDLSGTATDPQSLTMLLPDVLAAQRQVDVASAEVELRRRERRPDPTISFAGGEEDDKTLVGVNISIPLFVRNRFDHEVTAAMAERSQAQQLADDVLRRAYARLTSAAERYRLSRDAWRDWAAIGQLSVDRRFEQLQRLWEAGEISTTDYLVQVRQTVDVQDSALDLRQSLWRAWFEWLVASGQVDTWLGK